jgi:hypothetical protein
MDARLKRSGLTRWCKDTTTHIPMEGIKNEWNRKFGFFMYVQQNVGCVSTVLSLLHVVFSTVKYSNEMGAF